MCVIYCNLNLFSCNQMIYVIDENGQQIYACKTDIEEVARTIAALAAEHNIQTVRLSGQNVYANAWAEEIQSVYSLNFGKNNLNVEVV